MMANDADTAGWRFQEFQFDSELDDRRLRSLKIQRRIGGRVAHELRDLWEEEILARIELIEEPEQMASPLLRGRSPAPEPRKLTLTVAQGCYAVKVHVKVWTWAWETVLIGSLSHEQLAPFLHCGKLRARNYGKVLPLVARHRVYADACLLGMPELSSLLAGELPDLTLV
jgi:hypothetical protein